MVKLHDIVLEVPEYLERSRTVKDVQEAEVVYIHPEGRFYTICFSCGRSGKFTETRYFTQAEIEKGRVLGIFRKPSDAPVPASEYPELKSFKRITPGNEQKIKNRRLSEMSIDDIDAAM